MKLFASAKNEITKDKDRTNVPHLKNTNMKSNMSPLQHC